MIENGLSRIARNLPTSYKKILYQKIEEKSGTVLTERFNNWVKGKCLVPVHYQSLVNQASHEVVSYLLEELIPDNKLTFTLNLFKMDNKAQELTTIRAERALRNMTQADLAKETGIAPTTISVYEREAFLPQGVGISLKNAKTIATFFGKKIEDFREFQA